MEAQEIIRYIQTASKKTPVKVYLNVTEPIDLKKVKFLVKEAASLFLVTMRRLLRF
ncbi:2,3,4,5-tetrahydropyridine-2,6-carboxylate N-succinyltransferase [Enterococcus sp. GMD1E]|nr:2,3,4,5-tetrahydropyridine-2,6-carboxylate N-succinyltransferase [Enterococcus sp. GMD1E]